MNSIFTKQPRPLFYITGLSLFRQVPSRQRHSDRLKERLLEAMGSASKRIDDDTEA